MAQLGIRPLCARSSAARHLFPLLALLPFLCRGLQQPQYLCFNKMYGCTTQPGCWNENAPASVTQASIDLLLVSLNHTRGTPSRRLCLGYQFNVLDGSPAVDKMASLEALLALSLANDLPVVITIDPFEFWAGAQALWNWFDPAAPGFDPANSANVEWSGPSPQNATAIAWCNWGAQFRKAPHPNLASPAFRAAAAAAVRPFAARLAAWLRGTLAPLGREDLLAGVKVSWEAWVGVNFFFYPGGNAYVDSPPSQDPQAGIRESVQLGFAAVCTASPWDCPPPGVSLTQAQVDVVLHDYLEFAAGVVAAEGLPRHKLLTHAGTFFGAPPFASSVAFNSPSAAVTTAAKPGWSLYAFAFDPARAAGLAEALGALAGAPWAATEWRYMGGNSGAPVEQWRAAMENTLGFLNNRMLDVYNWENIPAEALAAAAEVLSAPPPCLVDSAANLTSARVNATAVALSWAPGAHADTVMLLASSVPLTLPSGELAAPNLAHAELPSAAAGLELPLPEGGPPAYWTVASRGCGGAQLAVAAVSVVGS
jgi:hypothetical protein